MTMRTKLEVALSLAVGLTASMAVAQQMEEVHSVTPAKAAVCVLVDGPISVDGVLDDAPWASAIPFSGFTSSTQGGLVPNTTRVMIVRDAEALYFGIRCGETHMDKLVATKTSRDSSVWSDDCVELFLDIEHQHRSFTQLVINSVPTVYDARDRSGTWDAEWQVASATDDGGWTLEIRMSWASLEIAPPEPGGIWGMNVCRERQTEQRKELHNWADVQGNFHNVWLFGHLFFANVQFEMNDTVAEKMYAAIEVPTKVYLREGYALIGPGGIAEKHGYRELLRDVFNQARGLDEMYGELREAYRAHGDLLFRDQFDDLQERYRDLQRAARGEGPLDPAEWSRQMAMVGTLADEMENLSWRVKVALLLKDA